MIRVVLCLIRILSWQACKERADAVLFLFAFTDRSSFEDVPALISRTLSQEEDAARVVIGTKYPYTQRQRMGGAHDSVSPQGVYIYSFLRAAVIQCVP